MSGARTVLARVLLSLVPLLMGASPDSPSPSAPEPSERESREADFEGTIRLGGEYDSNARRRADDGSVTPDGLTRYFLALEGRLPSTENASLQLRLQQGGKLFVQTSEADTLLTEAGMTYQHRLGSSLRLDLDVSLKDRLERRSRQDYSRGRAVAGPTLRLDPVVVRGRVGWRYFAFRPNPTSSSHGPTGSIDVGVHIVEGLQLQTQYTLSQRRFRADRLTRREDLVQRDEGTKRRDGLHVVRVGGAYRSSVILQAHYLFWANLSNAYGQGLRRHGVELGATIPLPWRLYVSSRLRLQRTQYEDPLLVGANFTVDENNRNSAIASLTRVIGDHWELEARYRLFLEEFGSASAYQRQTGFFGLGYVFD